ncbi:MAG: [FeFe] hydrogenase H-cluster radical SAM maturase HydG [Candidatus Muiribacterium halophilum]|uniref:[FeFe] hydrogenase H-cluster radical SAM maturase HydG n=1 Tax=Muiribacterium halophilum TaxID=2053465 RepID=A0A2N5ZFG5_MUIH1|nr:MAG: [FeFe] hydrogenase H-cluster radical SAM maturase HydG [Candidatus Muirbacterium halophilum]
MNKIIDEGKIFSLIEETKDYTISEVHNIINKALRKEGLSIKDVATLLNVDDPGLVVEIKSAAKKIKEDIYGKRIVIFAPLYVTNECINDCLYCGFRRSNTELVRKTLSLDELKRETQLLTRMGHKRVLLVCGEHPKYANADFVVEAIKTVYSANDGKNEIRRINVNLAPLEVEDFKKIKATGIGTYQEFQETYHRETYKKMHPSGPKSDYDYRITAFERAFEAGIDDLGAGVLFGLFDHKFETLALISHCHYLEKKIGVGPHTISIPRIEPALNAPAANTVPYPMSDDEFMKLVAIIRLAVPYTGIILSTRETTELRAKLIHLGVSQVSAGSKTDPGGYDAAEKDLATKQQFALGDFRTLDQVIYDLSKNGFIPSFCTGCYRLGRTGIDFMAITKPGLIQQYCQPNALVTFKEYLMDYASDRTRKAGEELIKKELDDFADKNGKEQTLEMLKKLENGERDIFC